MDRREDESYQLKSSSEHCGRMVVPLEIIVLDGDLIVNVSKDLSAVKC